jgi:polysaccharide biosynthesis protein PslH
MHDMLLLCLQVPRPAASGEPARIWRILRHLSSRYRVHLGCFGDDALDRRAEGFVRQFCHSSYIARPLPQQVKPRPLAVLAGSSPVPPLRHSGLMSWVERVWADRRPARALAVGSALGHYVMLRPDVPARRIIDRVELSGSEEAVRWAQPADEMTPLRRWLLARQARALLGDPGGPAGGPHADLIASSSIRNCLGDLLPDRAGRLHHLPDGVDADWFSPRHRFADPRPEPAPCVLLGGGAKMRGAAAAAAWFATAVLPILLARRPDLRFVVPGGAADPEFARLAGLPGVRLLGPVPDLRPWMAHSAAVVAPHRMPAHAAVLEPLAMARPLVASPDAVEGLGLGEGCEFWIADTPDAFVRSLGEALDPRLGTATGRAARRRIEAEFRWEALMDRLDRLLEGQSSPSQPLVWPMTSRSGH